MGSRPFLRPNHSSEIPASSFGDAGPVMGHLTVPGAAAYTGAPAAIDV